MRFSLTLFAIILFSAVSGAVLIQGPILKNTEGEIFCRLDNKSSEKPILVDASDRTIKKDLSKLEAGDWLIGYGNILPTPRKVVLNSISFVGLKRILGTWRDAQWDLFDFEDFSRLFLCPSTPFHAFPEIIDFGFGSKAGRPNEDCELQKLTYRIVPDSGSSWSIFIADQERVGVGSLYIGQQGLRLILYSESGEPVQDLFLSPLHLP